MPIINVNGSAAAITWTKAEMLALASNITVNTFMSRHGRTQDGHNFEPLPPSLFNILHTNNHWPTPVGLQAVPPQQATATPIPTIQDIAAAHWQEIDSFIANPELFSGLVPAKKVPEKNNTNKLLQEIYKYKAMTLRKTDSIHYEKSHKVDTPFEWATTQGMIGIEIEVENMKKSVPLDAYWEIKSDGSLRNNGLEFVSVPLQVKQVQLALDHLYTQMNLNNAPDFSNRTSIHIHVNCRDLTQDQIYNFVLLYALFEKHFYQVAGTRRMNSIFCVPLFRTNQLTSLNDVVYGLGSNWQKYCGINLLPLFQNPVTQGYGTIEFRHLYGTSDKQEIFHWINDILCLRKFACEISKDDLLAAIKEMNTTSSYMAMYSQVFAKGRKLLSNKKDFEDCVSNIKRELFGEDYTSTLKKSDASIYWQVAREIGARG